MQTYFNNLEFSVLVDLLSKEETKYNKLVNEGGPKWEFDDCKLMIQSLQSEINTRKRTGFRRPDNPFDQE